MIIRSLIRSAIFAIAASCAAVTPALAQTLRAGNGTAAAPSITFNGALTTGLARPSGGDTIYVATAGVTRTWVDSAGIKLLNGSLSRPSIAFKSALNTGMYLSGSNLAFVRQGAASFSLASGGHLALANGVQVWLDAGSASNPALAVDADVNSGLYNPGGDTATFAIGGVRALSVAGGANTTVMGGAGNMLLRAGFGNSRTMSIQTTTSGGTPTTAISLNETQQARFKGGAANSPSIIFNSGAETSGLWSTTDTVVVSTANVRSFSIGGGASPTLLGGAGSMTIQAGTGNSRSLSLQATTNTGTAITGLAVQTSTSQVTASVNNGTSSVPGLSFSSSLNSGLSYQASDTVSVSTGANYTLRVSGGSDAKLTGGAGNMTITAGTGNSRTMTLQTTTSAGTAKNTLVLGADTTLTPLGTILAYDSFGTSPPYSFAAQNTLGFARSNNNESCMVVSSSCTFRFNGSGSATLAGSAATPSYSFVSGSGNGMYWVDNGTSDTLGLSSTGVAFLKGKNDTLLVPSRAKFTSNLTDASGTPGTLCYITATREIVENAATSCVVSAARFKTDIQTLDPEYATRSVMAMEPVSFTYKDGGRLSLGVIAEKMDSIDHRLAFKNADGQINSYDQSGTIAMMLATIQQQQRTIAALTARVEAMEKRKP